VTYFKYSALYKCTYYYYYYYTHAHMHGFYAASQLRPIVTDGVAWSFCLSVRYDREPCRNG